MTHIGFVSGRGKRAVEDHFDISYELEHQIKGTPKENLLEDIRYVIDCCTFSYTRQIEIRGLGDAILTGESLMAHEPFGVLLADDFCTNGEEGVLKQMVQLFEKYQCSIVAIEEVPADQTQSYGIIEGDEIEDGIFKVSNMVEKPSPDEAPTNMAIIGRYILTPDIFDILRNTKPGRASEIQITDAISAQAKERMVLAYKFKGRRFDCGSIEGFVQATNYVYNRQYAGEDSRLGTAK